MSTHALLAVAAVGGALAAAALVADSTWGHENLPIPVLRAGAQVGVVDGCAAARHRIDVLLEASLTDDEPLSRADATGVQALTEGCPAGVEELIEDYLGELVPGRLVPG